MTEYDFETRHFIIVHRFKGQMHGYGLFKYPDSDIVISQFNYGKRVKDRGLYISGTDPKNIITW